MISSCAQNIAAELRGRALGPRIVIEGLALRVLVEALRALPRGGVEHRAVDTTPRLHRREFVQACEFMRRCPKDAFSFERLCRSLGSSKDRFTRPFLAATSSTLASFYNRMLLEHSRELLQDPALSRKEVSGLLGFKIPEPFHRRLSTPLRQSAAGVSAGVERRSGVLCPPVTLGSAVSLGPRIRDYRPKSDGWN